MVLKLIMGHVCGMTRMNQVEKNGALLSKIGFSRIVDFCHFTKISQLLQGTTCSIFKLFTCSWTFWKGLWHPAGLQNQIQEEFVQAEVRENKKKEKSAKREEGDYQIKILHKKNKVV